MACTVVRILPDPWDVACDKWAVQDWREWPAPSPCFHWLFREELTIFVKSGHGVIRPIGLCANDGPHVVASGNLLILPGGFRAVWDAGDELVIAWRQGHVALEQADIERAERGLRGSASTRVQLATITEEASAGGSSVSVAPATLGPMDTSADAAATEGSAGAVVRDDLVIALPDGECSPMPGGHVGRKVYKACLHVLLLVLGHHGERCHGAIRLGQHGWR